MGLNLGKWSEIEKNMLMAGASNELMMTRTGRTLFSVNTARTKLNKILGRKIVMIADTRFLAEERRKIRELRKQKLEAKQEQAGIVPKKTISLEEIRSKREKDWIPTASGAGVMCVPKKKILLRDNIVKYRSNPLEPAPIDPKTIHQETGRVPFKKVEPEVLNIEVDESIKKMAENSVITVIEPAPSKDELFFDVNGTQVRVSAGTKKVDIMPYGLIIEF